eukprot:6208935-Pleurochrysis_carterae.AAC.1
MQRYDHRHASGLHCKAQLGAHRHAVPKSRGECSAGGLWSHVCETYECVAANYITTNAATSRKAVEQMAGM